MPYSLATISFKIGKWASVPLIFAVAVGLYLASQCTTTSFFGLNFGANCNGTSSGDGASIWTNSDEFQGEVSKSFEIVTGSAKMFGTSFHKSIRNGTLLAAARRGVDIHYLFLNPCLRDNEMARIAKRFDQDADHLRAELTTTFYGLRKASDALRKEENESHLQARVVDEPIGIRLYSFTPSRGGSQDDSVAYFVPYVYGTDSPDLLGFSYYRDIPDPLLEAAEHQWKSATPLALDRELDCETSSGSR